MRTPFRLVLLSPSRASRGRRLLRLASLLLAAALSCVALPPQAIRAQTTTVELHADSPDFFGRATTDGVPADFLSARGVSARILHYDRPLVEMLAAIGGRLRYESLRSGHAVRRSFYSPASGGVVTVEYRFLYHPETKEAELTDILVDGRLLGNDAFYDYADELCRPARP